MQGLRVLAKNQEQFKFVIRHEELPGFDFLKAPRSGEIEVLVTADRLQQFKKDLQTREIEHEVFVDDVAQVLEESFEQQRLAQKRRSRSGGFNLLRSFPRYDDVTYQTFFTFFSYCLKYNYENSLFSDIVVP